MRQLFSRFSSTLVPLLLAGLGLALSGCGSSVKTTLQKDWEVTVEKDTRTVTVDPQRGHVLVGADKNTTLFGTGGTVLYGEKRPSGPLAKIASKAKEAASTGMTSLSGMKANKLDYVMLPSRGVALVFDYTADDDIIRALNLKSGQKRWERRDYQWSLEKYQAVGAKVVEGVIKNVGVQAGLAAGAASAAANTTLLRERYVKNLVAPVPNQNAILLKTVGELRRVDLATGQTQWTLEEVPGSRLLHVEWLPSGDVLVVTNHTSLLEKVSGGKQVLRLNPKTGRVKWRSSHEADLVQQTFRKKGYFLLQKPNGDVQAFRLADGTRAYEIGMGLTEKLTNLKGATYSRGKSGATFVIEPVVHESAIYIPNITDLQVVGPPSHNVRKFSVATGDPLWASDTIEAMNALQDLGVAGNRLVGRAARFTGGVHKQEVVGWSLSTGTAQWRHRTPYERSRKAWRSGAFAVKDASTSRNLVTSDGRAYVATDTSVVAYDVADGAVEASAPAKAPGKLVTLYQKNGVLVDLRAKGVSFHAPSNLSATRKPIPFASTVRTFTQKGDYLMVTTKNAIYAINTSRQTLAGTIVPKKPLGTMRVSGNLRDGVFMTAESIFLYRKDHVVQKYRLP